VIVKEGNMIKEKLEKKLNKHIVVGVPHFTRDDILFYYSGILTSVGENGFCLERKDGEEIYLTFDRVREFRPSGSEGSNESRD